MFNPTKEPGLIDTCRGRSTGACGCLWPGGAQRTSAAKRSSRSLSSVTDLAVAVPDRWYCSGERRSASCNGLIVCIYKSTRA